MEASVAIDTTAIDKDVLNSDVLPRRGIEIGPVTIA